MVNDKNKYYFSLKWKITITFLVILIVPIFSTLWGAKNLINMGVGYRHLADAYYPIMETTNTITVMLYDIKDAYLLSRRDSDQEKLLVAQKLSARIEQYFKRLQTLNHNDPAGGKLYQNALLYFEKENYISKAVLYEDKEIFDLRKASDEMLHSIESLFREIKLYSDTQNTAFANNSEGLITATAGKGKIVMICAFATLIMGLTLAYLSQRYLMRRLNMLIKAIEDIAIGNGDLSKRIVVRGNDELASLAMWLNRFTARLQKLFNNDNLESAINKRTATLLYAKESAEKAKSIAIQSSKAKSDFLTNMSHEFRTPLNAIIGFSELLSESPLASDQKAFNENVLKGSRSLLMLINELLDFSKIESGRVELESVPFEIRALAQEVVDVVSLSVVKSRVNLEVRIQQDIPQLINGDPLRLKQILLNLMNNAVKFTKDGEIILTIRLSKQTELHTWLHVSVKDSGIGIENEKCLDILTAFGQADNSTTRNYGGTGLGLSISAGLVEQMHGLLAIDSTPGVGSDFYFVIRVENAESTIPHH